MRSQSLILFFLLMLTVFPTSQGEETDQTSQVEALLAKMTSEEKAAQLQGVYFKDLLEDGHLSIAKCQEKIPNGIGEISSYGGSNSLTAPEIKSALAQLQQYLRTQTKLGIPAMTHEEAITGLPVIGATTYPQMIGMASTWDPELLQRNADATREAMRWIGGSHALSPVLDVHNNAHWGRIEEAFGEEPYLTSLMGLAFVQGIQGADLRQGIAATAKHFAGYGDDLSNLAHVYDEILMSHEVAVRMGHIASVMTGYHRFQNIPCSASAFLISDILRQKWGFAGIVVSDYYSLKEVFSKKYAATAVEAAKDCLEAGADLDLPDGETYGLLPKMVSDGVIPVSLVDQSVRRILRLKFKLGLMDSPKPETKVSIPYDINSQDNRNRAYQSACESLVLLKNDGNILPLSKSIHSIAVAGPNADSYYSLLGDYTHQMLGEFWHRIPADAESPKLITLLAGLKEREDRAVQIVYSRGCDWSNPLDKVVTSSTGAVDPRSAKAQRVPLEAIPNTDPQAALKIAASSDIIIAAMGENRYLCGETKDRADVRLPGDQEKFVLRLIATGKPVILVVFGGRPMVLTEVVSGCQAVVYAWYPGQEGGFAVADLLLGRFNPSGKLTITLPRNNEQVPIYYRNGYSDDNPPLYPFGYGLSFTNYSYTKLQVPDKIKTTDTQIPIQFQITNTGTKEGVEICQLYFSPLKPVPGERPIELKGFGRVALKPKETRTVTIMVSPQQLARHDETGALTLNPESYEIRVGASSTDIRLRATVDLVGEKISLPERTQFFSQTQIQ